MELTQEQKNVLAEYEELSIQENEIKDRKEALKPLLVDIVPEGTDLQAKSGVFKLKSRTTYVFSEKHKEMKDALKQREADEKKDGTAKEQVISFVEYRQAK